MTAATTSPFSPQPCLPITYTSALTTNPTCVPHAQNYKSNTVSHNLVASFQQNQLLEKNQLRLSYEAKNVLKKMGPEEFRARWGLCLLVGPWQLPAVRSHAV